jgi:hypothetical protein
MAMEHLTAHAALALARLATQLQDKPRLAGLLTATCTQVQAVEDVLWALYTERRLDTAVGMQLDDLGKLLGLGRWNSEGDSVYRVKLKARALVLRAGGTLDDIFNVASKVESPFTGGSSGTITISDEYPAAFFLVPRFVQLSQSSVTELCLRFLGPVKPAGVRGLLGWFPAGETNCFGFAGSLGKGFDTGSDVSPNFDGGVWAEVTEIAT